MSEPPSQLPSPPPSPAPATQEVYDIAHLDALLASYLELLDTYTILRNDLSVQLCSGFFSLAQAQRSSMLPPGQRYGEEMYDGRMKASRRTRIGIQSGSGSGRSQEEEKFAGIEIHQYLPAAEEAAISSKDAESEKGKRREEQKEDQNPDMPTSPPAEAVLPKEKPSTRSTQGKDPLRWFGVLTPQPLRACQASFDRAVSKIPDLIKTSREMAELEDEIQRVRKVLGLNVNAEDQGHSATADNEDDEEADAEEVDQKSNRNVPAPLKRRTLAPRSKIAEPRSRVLKLYT